MASLCATWPDVLKKLCKLNPGLGVAATDTWAARAAPGPEEFAGAAPPRCGCATGGCRELAAAVALAVAFCFGFGFAVACGDIAFPAMPNTGSPASQVGAEMATVAK